MSLTNWLTRLFRREQPQPERYVMTVADLERNGANAPYFRVSREGQISSRLTSAAEIDEFLDACGMPAGSGNAAAAKSGVPFEIDGATMVLEATWVDGWFDDASGVGALLPRGTQRSKATVADHDFRPPRLTLAYATEAVRLWLTGRIRFSVLRHALRHHPAGVSGTGAFHIVDRQAADAYFGCPHASESQDADAVSRVERRLTCRFKERTPMANRKTIASPTPSILPAVGLLVLALVGAGLGGLSLPLGRPDVTALLGTGAAVTAAGGGLWLVAPLRSIQASIVALAGLAIMVAACSLL